MDHKVVMRCDACEVRACEPRHVHVQAALPGVPCARSERSETRGRAPKLGIGPADGRTLSRPRSVEQLDLLARALLAARARVAQHHQHGPRVLLVVACAAEPSPADASSTAAIVGSPATAPGSRAST